MSSERKYGLPLPDLEKKLARVMDRLGVEEGKYQYDWTSGRSGASCYVEMTYNGRAYRFSNDTAKSAASGRNLTYASDLFAAVVYALEGLARSVEQGIFTLDMLLEGKLALPEGREMEACFVALGFSTRPTRAADVTARYRELVKNAHPDAGGSEDAFIALREAYQDCLTLLGDET